jgi:hypothetical protein
MYMAFKIIIEFEIIIIEFRYIGDFKNYTTFMMTLVPCHPLCSGLAW